MLEFTNLWQKIIRTAANLTSTLLIHHIVLKLETILDKEAKITHEQFAAQIESRIGTGDGEGAKGPDMKVWSKGRGLSDVRSHSRSACPCGAHEITLGRLGGNRVLLHSHYPISVHEHRLRPSLDCRIVDRPHSSQRRVPYRRWVALQRLLCKPWA